ncbi:Hypothetical predicted protein [Octopus vulgaris]|uniref:Uncharacterized protein n=1 Tax=Octopus vulgaris TaxID=6645 RepID=A0AA36F662_OCTVU|nr:Hypothetical predicted protein [Octopus vulgaris]
MMIHVEVIIISGSGGGGSNADINGNVMVILTVLWWHMSTCPHVHMSTCPHVLIGDDLTRPLVYRERNRRFYNGDKNDSEEIKVNKYWEKSTKPYHFETDHANPTKLTFVE